MTYSTRVKQALPPLFGFVSLVAAWQLTANYVGTSVLLTPPMETVNLYIQFPGIFIGNLMTTLREVVIAFVSSGILAMLLAVFLTWDERLEESFMPLVVGLNSVPRITLAPIIVFYLGGIHGTTLIAAWICFFPMAVNFVEGLGLVDEDRENLMRSLGATKLQEYRYIRFPSGLPLIFDGLKLGVSSAFVGAIIAEFVIAGGQRANPGLGYLVARASKLHQIDLVIAGILATAAIAVVVFYTILLIQDRLIHWREASIF